MSTKTLKIPKTLTREAKLMPTGEAQEKQFGFSVSSDDPYLRYDWMSGEDYYEVLDHGPGGLDDTRLKGGLPILYNHNRDQHLGRAMNATNDGHKLTVGGMIWSESEFAQEKKRDMMNGSLPDTSVGYEIIDDGTCVGQKDGIPIYKFKWRIMEASAVTVPADPTVGVGRQRQAPEGTEFREIQVTEKKSVDENGNSGKNAPNRKNMADEPNPTEKGLSIEVVEQRERAARENAVKEERQRTADIEAFAASVQHLQDNGQLKKSLAELKAEAMKNGTAETLQKSVMENWKQATALSAADADPNIGMSDKEIRQFSFAKFFLQSATGKLEGLEKEASQIAAEKYARDGRSFNGHCIPHDVLTADFAKVNGLGKRGLAALYERVTEAERMLGRSQNATSFTAGGFIVGVNLMAGSYIDVLRNAALIGNGPFAIIELNGLTGNIAIPRQTSTVTTYWLAEGATVTESNFAGGQLLFSPKRLVTRNSFTKQLLAQGTPSIEMLVRNDMAQAQAVEEDRVAIQGTGLNGEPIGVINTSGIDASVTFSGNWTQNKSLAFEYALENANVRNGEAVFLTTPLTKSYAKGTVQVASSTFPIYIWMPSTEYPSINGVKGGVVNGYGAYATKNATNRVLYSVWNNNFTRARWAGIDVVVNPYTGDASELIYVTMTQWLDQGLRYPQAASYSTDAPTSPS